MSTGSRASWSVVACIACAACGFLAARSVEALPLAGGGRQPTPQALPAGGTVPTLSASRGSVALVERVGGLRFTVLDAHQGATFRAAAVEADQSAEDAVGWDAPGAIPVPYVSITMLIEPDAPGASASVSFDGPTWGWPMEVTPDGGRATPVLRYAFVSETIIPDVKRPAGDHAAASSSVRVPPVPERSELKTIIIYGRHLPEGAATFTSGVSIEGKSLGTLRFTDLPMR